MSWGVISWTPDGRHVVIGGPDVDKLDELWRFPATGGKPRKTNFGIKVIQLALHPDGRRVAFSRMEPRTGAKCHDAH